MNASSPFARADATQVPVASRKDQFASLASRVEQRVENVRRAMVNNSTRGLASDVASAMGWRIERRSRELNGTEKLSLANVLAEIELHRVNGENEAADAIVAALVDELRDCPLKLTPGSVYHVFDKNGQLFVRFGQ